jgi:hypothetical protein
MWINVGTVTADYWELMWPSAVHKFGTVPDAMWWVIVTLGPVGTVTLFRSRRSDA